MTLLILIGIVWGASALVKACRENKRQRELERQRVRQAQRNAEIERMRAEWKRQQAETKAETARLIALEREQMRITREQERQAKEQARQAEQLARHEEQLAKLEFRMTQAEADIAAESERIASLYALMDIAAAEQAAAVPGSKTDIRAQKQIISYQSAIHAAEKRRAKAEFSKKTAQQKLTA
jgi:hypothetical protein